MPLLRQPLTRPNHGTVNPEVAQHRLRGSTSAEHRSLNRRGVAVIATHESPVAEVDRLLRIQRWRLCGLAMRDDISAEMLPVAGHGAEPPGELVAHTGRDGRVECLGPGDRSSDEGSTRRSVGRAALRS